MKINREKDFLRRLSSSNPVNWPELDFYPNENPAWYSQNVGILFHARMECMEDLFKITAAANNIGTCDVTKRASRFVDCTWHFEYDENEICEACSLKLCLEIIKKKL